MFADIKFMKGEFEVLESSKLGMLKFFTVDSNIFMGIVALIFAIDEYKLLKGKIESISKFKYILKLMSTTAVGLTFFTVFLYLGPIASDGIYSMLLNSNLFFHLIIPVLSMINFILVEKTTQIKQINCFVGVAPSFVYATAYLINVLVHMDNGKVSPMYDWYYFVQNGVWTAVLVVPFMAAMTYLLCIALYKLNRLGLEKK